MLHLNVFTYVLLGTGSVGILVLLRGEEIHAGDAVEKGCLKLSSDASLGDGGETLNGSDKDKSEDNGVRLHDSGCMNWILKNYEHTGIHAGAGFCRKKGSDNESETAITGRTPVPNIFRH